MNRHKLLHRTRNRLHHSHKLTPTFGSLQIVALLSGTKATTKHDNVFGSGNNSTKTFTFTVRTGYYITWQKSWNWISMKLFINPSTYALLHLPLNDRNTLAVCGTHWKDIQYALPTLHHTHGTLLYDAKITHCCVWHTPSVFWIRALLVSNHTQTISSPFSVSRFYRVTPVTRSVAVYVALAYI